VKMDEGRSRGGALFRAGKDTYFNTLPDQMCGAAALPESDASRRSGEWNERL